MSLKTFLHNLLHSDAAKSIEGFVITEAQKAVAVLKTTHIGASVAQAIDDATNISLTGAEKLEKVIADVSPELVTLLLNKGQRTIDATEVYSTMKELAQSIFNDVKSTTAGTVAQTILKDIGA